jgi:hypothetical protein
MELAALSFGGADAEGKTEPQSGPIGAMLLERPKQVLGFAGWETPAAVLDLEENAVVRFTDHERDAALLSSKLECIVEQIRNDRGEDVSISLHGPIAAFDRSRKVDSARGGLRHVSDFHGFDELRYRNAFETPDPRLEPHFDE